MASSEGPKTLDVEPRDLLAAHAKHRPTPPGIQLDVLSPRLSFLHFHTTCIFSQVTFLCKDYAPCLVFDALGGMLARVSDAVVGQAVLSPAEVLVPADLRHQRYVRRQGSRTVA